MARNWNFGELTIPQLRETLEDIKIQMFALGERKVEDLPNKIRKARGILDSLNGRMSGADIDQARLELETLLGVENNHLKVRSKVHCLRNGDQNTSYFHHHASHHHRRHTIHSIKNVHGSQLQNFKR